MTPEELAALDAAQDKQIRELAAQITQMTKLGFDPLTIRKGIVAAVNDATAPPTVSINISGDTSTLVAQVRTLNNYTPLVNQTVLVAKQGTEIFLLGSIASVNPTGAATGQEASTGWVKATLSNGSHNGNGNGDIYYRRVLDHGSWKMQWQGGWSPSGSSTMIDTGDALDPIYRPAVPRSLLAARSANNRSDVKIDFTASGTVLLIAPTNGTSSATVEISDSGSTGSAQTSSTVSHSHGGEVTSSSITHNDGFHSHSWSAYDTDSHSHTVAHPTWVSLNGLEYFL